MTELSDFSAIVLLVSVGLVLAVLSILVADRISLPSAPIFLLATGRSSSESGSWLSS